MNTYSNHKWTMSEKFKVGKNYTAPTEDNDVATKKYVDDAGWWASSQTIFLSDNIPSANNPSITHNLWVTQADVEAGRYEVKFMFNDSQDECVWNIFANHTSNGYTQQPEWADTTPSGVQWVNREANIVHLNGGGTNLRIAIIDNRATGIGYEKITNNAWYAIFDSTMNWTTTVTINDSRIDEETPFNVYFESEPVGNITKEAHIWSITIASDDASDTMDFRIVAFNMWTDTYITSDVHTLDWAWPRTIVDWNITVDTPVNLFPIDTPAGYLTIEAQAGQVVITSTATETNLEVKYIAFTELSIGSILDWAYDSSWDWDTTNAPSRNAVYDKIESIWQGVNTITSWLKIAGTVKSLGYVTKYIQADANFVYASIVGQSKIVKIEKTTMEVVDTFSIVSQCSWFLYLVWEYLYRQRDTWPTLYRTHTTTGVSTGLSLPNQCSWICHSWDNIYISISSSNTIKQISHTTFLITKDWLWAYTWAWVIAVDEWDTRVFVRCGTNIVSAPTSTLNADISNPNQANVHQFKVVWDKLYCSWSDILAYFTISTFSAVATTTDVDIWYEVYDQTWYMDYHNWYLYVVNIWEYNLAKIDTTSDLCVWITRDWINIKLICIYVTMRIYTKI